MIWNDHSNLDGCHATLSPSAWTWINQEFEEYDDLAEALFKRFKSSYSTSIGTFLHEYAKDRIDFRLRLQKASKTDVLLHLLKNKIPKEVIDMDYLYDNFMNYVNDAIGFHMDTEKALVYSPECYGHADAIFYSQEKKILRIHDYKSGTTPAHIEQLRAYAALFFLEYKIQPENTQTILRIYQTDNEIEEESDPNDIRSVMNTIITDVKVLQSFRNGRI